MGIWILGGVVGFGLLFTIIMAISIRLILKQLPRSGKLPVTILKPLKGVDPDLEANLHSIFNQEYPEQIEIILGAEDPDDPALEVARRVVANYPNHLHTITSGGPAVGYNPKINNLANLYSKATHRIVVINDSNTRVPKHYISDLCGHLVEAEGALVWSPFRGTGERGLGGTLEALHLNTQVLGGMAAVTKVIGMPCALGKSMMFTAEHLKEIGGFEYLGQYLAEDQIMAEEMGKHKVSVRMTGVVVDNVLGYRSLKDYMGRQIRWARLRRSMKWLGYTGELLLNPTFIAMIGAVCLRSTASLGIFGLALVGMAALEACMERMAGVRRNLLLYPLLELILSTCRGLMWPLGFLSSRVIWRGNILKVGPRSQLQKTAPLKNADKVHSVVG